MNITEIVEKIHREIDIVSLIGEFVPLSKKGRSFVGLCPFHPDKNPSMSVSPQKQVYNCFVCDNKGDVITFLAEFKKIPRLKAIQELAARLGVTLDESAVQPRYNAQQIALVEALKLATQFYQNQLDRHPESSGVKYALKRGLTPVVRAKFKIGLALNQNELSSFLKTRGLDEAVLINASLVNSRGNDFFTNRLMFAITNEFDDVIGFSGRTLDNHDAKYMNSSDSLIFHKQAVLYNFYNAKDASIKSRALYVCEGQMDVIALDRAGFANAVAIMGTALTPEHLRVLPRNIKIVLNFDSDKAGVNATLRSLPLLMNSGFEARVVDNTASKDADEVLAASGIDGVKNLLKNELSAVDWALKTCAQGLDLSASAGIETYLAALRPVLSVAPELDQQVALQQLSTKLQLTPPLLLKMLNLTKSAPVTSRVDSTPPPSSSTPFFARYTYALLRTLLTKPALINYFLTQREQVFIAERQLEQLLNYAVARPQLSAQNALDEGREAALQSAVSRADFAANSEIEFSDLIARVNEEFYDYHIDAQKKLLKKGVTDHEASVILTTISKYKQKKRELAHDKETE